MSKLLLLCIVSALSMGCPATLPYQPNDRAVETLGIPQARQRLQKTIWRAINPQGVEADATADSLHDRYRQAIDGFPTGAILENRVFFVHAARVEVFANNAVNVWTSTNQLLAQVTFGNTDDTKTFADRVASFRSRHARGAR